MTDEKSSPLKGVELYEKANQMRDEGDYEESFRLYRQALDNLDDLVLRMMVFYDWALAHDFGGTTERSSHYFQRAMNVFQEFSAQNPYDERMPTLTGLMWGAGELLQARALVDENATDYQACIRSIRWPKDGFPLKVCIQSDDGGFDDSLCDLIWSAFMVWTDASEHIRLRRVLHWGSDVDIHVIRALPGMIPASAGGQTTFEETPEEGLINRAKVRLYCAGRQSSQLTDKQKDAFYSLALHEAGHALGLDGHSPFGSDLMYWKSPLMMLSERDKNTIHRWYS